MIADVELGRVPSVMTLYMIKVYSRHRAMCYQAEENSCLNMSVSVATDGTAQLLCSMSPHLLFECSIVPMCVSSKEGHGHWLSCSSIAVQTREPGNLCKCQVGVVASEAEGRLPQQAD